MRWDQAMTDRDTSAPTASGRVLSGFVVLASGSLLAMLVQLLYASFTARLLTPDSFGAYAVALSAVGFIAMLSGTALGQATARRDRENAQLDTSLATVAATLGLLALMAALIAAPIWARVWSSPDSVSVTRLLACSIPGTAIGAVSAGVLRRQGRTTVVARATVVGQIAGVVCGAVAVAATRTTTSLGVAAVAASIMTAGMLHARLPRPYRRFSRPTRECYDDLVYSTKTGGLSFVRYFTNLIPLWSISRFVGAQEVGAFNRAVTVLTIPIETVQRSFTYTLFPEVRPKGPAARSDRDVLTHVMILVTWPAVVLGVTGYFVAPFVLRLVLGPQWAEAESLAGPAVLLGVAPIIAVPMSATLEAHGRFRVTATGWLLSASAIIAGATVAAILSETWAAMAGMIAAPLLAATLYAFKLSRSGLFTPRLYYAGIRSIVLIQAVVLCLFIAVGLLGFPAFWELTAYVSITACEVGLLWLVRTRTPFGRVAQSYELPGFR